MHPVQAGCHPQAGLVEVPHRRRAQSATDRGQHTATAHVGGGSCGEGGHRTRRDRHAEQLADRIRGAFFGQELPRVEVGGDRGDVGSVTGRRPHALQRATSADTATHAASRHHPMLGYRHDRLRDVENLPAHHPRQRRHPKGSHHSRHTLPARGTPPDPAVRPAATPSRDDPAAHQAAAPNGPEASAAPASQTASPTTADATSSSSSDPAEPATPRSARATPQPQPATPRSARRAAHTTAETLRTPHRSTRSTDAASSQPSRHLTSYTSSSSLLSSSRRGFHPPALTEPCLNLSVYTALAVLVTRLGGPSGPMASGRRTGDAGSRLSPMRLGLSCALSTVGTFCVASASGRN